MQKIALLSIVLLAATFPLLAAEDEPQRRSSVHDVVDQLGGEGPISQSPRRPVRGSGPASG